MVMGEASAEVWTNEFRRTGRVVFPVRRRPVVVRLVLIVVLGTGGPVMSLGDWHARGGLRLAFVVLGLASYGIFAGVMVWQLITQRPTLTVDDEGIRLGRKRFMAWTDVGTIGIPTGPKFFMFVPVLQRDIWAKELRIPQDNVKDIPAFAAWLTEVLAERRRAKSA
jgi:hypothetical protein